MRRERPVQDAPSTSSSRPSLPSFLQVSSPLLTFPEPTPEPRTTTSCPSIVPTSVSNTGHRLLSLPPSLGLFTSKVRSTSRTLWPLHLYAQLTPAPRPPTISRILFFRSSHSERPVHRPPRRASARTRARPSLVLGPPS